MKIVLRHGTALTTVILSTMARRWLSCLLLLLMAAAGAVGADLSENAVLQQKYALTNTLRDTRITGVVTDARGTDAGNLKMLSAFVEMLDGRREARGCRLGEYVTRVRAKGEQPLETPSNVSMHRILSVDSDPDLSSLEGASVSFFDGWSEEALHTNMRVCLIPVDMETSDDCLPVSTTQGEFASLKVIGTITGGRDDVIYCPFFMQWEDGLSVAFYADSCSFDIRDNTLLEESKAELYKWFVEPNLNNQTNGSVFGVIVKDETFQKTIQEIQDNISLFQLLRPALVAICGCMGFLGTFLYTRGRTKEFGIMRCLGLSKFRVSGLIIAEFLMLSFLGYVTGTATAIVIDGFVGANAILNALIVTVFYMLGSLVAVVRIVNKSVMKIMKME